MAITAGNSWIQNKRLNPRAGMRLFCFPYAAGSTAIFRTWPRHFPGTIEICPVQLPGRGGRFSETPHNRLRPLVHAATQALFPYLDKPFSFFGHSMGAIISFEVSRLLRREYGREPAYIFVSGRRAPQIPCVGSLTHNLATPAFIEELRRLNGTPREVIENPELMKLMLPIIRADFEVCETYDYIPEPPLNCPIAAFGGLQDEDVSIGHLEGWRLQTTGPFSLHLFGGDHFYLHRYQSLLIKAISQELLRCNKADKPETIAPFGSPHKSVQAISTAEA